ncbi:MAG: hypothetical protein IPG92_16480 [Flavobacteriales bacterium]|nr:hypothetical protein [Flavobacteriales bacterium]
MPFCAPATCVSKTTVHIGGEDLRTAEEVAVLEAQAHARAREIVALAHGVELTEQGPSFLRHEQYIGVQDARPQAVLHVVHLRALEHAVAAQVLCGLVGTAGGVVLAGTQEHAARDGVRAVVVEVVDVHEAIEQHTIVGREQCVVIAVYTHRTEREPLSRLCTRRPLHAQADVHHMPSAGCIGCEDEVIVLDMVPTRIAQAAHHAVAFGIQPGEVVQLTRLQRRVPFRPSDACVQGVGAVGIGDGAQAVGDTRVHEEDHACRASFGLHLVAAACREVAVVVQAVLERGIDVVERNFVEVDRCGTDLVLQQVAEALGLLRFFDRVVQRHGWPHPQDAVVRRRPHHAFQFGLDGPGVLHRRLLPFHFRTCEERTLRGGVLEPTAGG